LAGARVPRAGMVRATWAVAYTGFEPSDIVADPARRLCYDPLGLRSPTSSMGPTLWRGRPD